MHPPTEFIAQRSILFSHWPKYASPPHVRATHQYLLLPRLAIAHSPPWRYSAPLGSPSTALTSPSVFICSYLCSSVFRFFPPHNQRNLLNLRSDFGLVKSEHLYYNISRLARSSLPPVFIDALHLTSPIPSYGRPTHLNRCPIWQSAIPVHDQILPRPGRPPPSTGYRLPHSCLPPSLSQVPPFI
jgi:hypothetical protein